MRRVPVQLHGGPLDRALIFVPEGTIEFEFECEGGRVAVYEIKGRWGSFIELRPGPAESPSLFDGR